MTHRLDPPPELAMLDRYGRRLDRIPEQAAAAGSFEEAMASVAMNTAAARIDLESIQARLKVRDAVLKSVLSG